MKSKLFFLILLSIFSSKLNAQQPHPYLKVGDKIEDYTFNELINSPRKRISISDYRGKWLVLDFWSLSCPVCIKELPKIDQIAKAFADKLEVLAVSSFELGKNDAGKTYKEMTENLFNFKAERYKFKIASAFDNDFFKISKITSTPVVFVIDPDGNLAAKATSVDSTSIANIIQGKSAIYPIYYFDAEDGDARNTFARPASTISTGNDTALVGRAILTKSNGGFEFFNTTNGHSKAVGEELPYLYKFGYTGKEEWDGVDSLSKMLFNELILETKNPSIFFADSSSPNLGNRYNYSLTIPRDLGPTEMRKILINDLDRFLGLKSSIQVRKVPIYKLVVIDQKKVLKLKAKGGSINYKPLNYAFKGFEAKNIPLARFAASLEDAVRDNNKPGYVLDGTGLNFPIDIKFDVNRYDWFETINFLNKMGFGIIADEKEMPCIVIQDAY